jgi:hypothetical protein
MIDFRTIRIYATATLVIVAIAVGYALLLKTANAKVEARCAANGGQVLVTPGDVSRCLQPAR